MERLAVCNIGIGWGVQAEISTILFSTFVAWWADVVDHLSGSCGT